jgi:outer membrane protein assembly factor BamB
MQNWTRLCSLLVLLLPLAAQDWLQWGQNSRHSGAVNVSGQRLTQIQGQYQADKLADAMRSDFGGNLLVHYMAPLVYGDEVFTLSRGGSKWVSCREGQAPCGAQRWGQMEWGVTKLKGLREQWTVISDWKPAPNTGSSWEPVFHPALYGPFLYVPASGGMVLKVDRETGEVVDRFAPFEELDPNRYVVSPLTMDEAGALYYTVLRLDAGSPWTRDVLEATLVKISATGETLKADFRDLIPDAPSGEECLTTFAGANLPWPPSLDAMPPMGPCGSQRPGLNAAPAVGPDGTVVIVSRAHFNSAYSYLVAVNPDLTPQWSASLRDRLKDGCDVLLPASGTEGGCREGSLTGVDPATNQWPAGRVVDQSTASPVIAPDGSILYGAYTAYNYSRGHLLHFSATGEYLGSYDFGWDITPAVYEHDGTWSVIVKDNFYPVGSYCGAFEYCGRAEAKYRLTSLNAELAPEWTFRNTNDQLCERLSDGSMRCEQVAEPGFEWCVNMVAVDRDGVVYANSEDGNVYAIDRQGQEVGRLFLKVAIGAAYTPLAIGADGSIYAQNDGVVFKVGEDGTSQGAGSTRKRN